MPGVPHEAWDVYATDYLVKRIWKRVTELEQNYAAQTIGRRVMVAQLREVRLGLSELRRRHDQISLF